MQTVVCPICESTLKMSDDDVTLHTHLFCGECETMLEVVSESPLVLSPVDDDDDFDDDDLEEDDDL